MKYMFAQITEQNCWILFSFFTYSGYTLNCNICIFISEGWAEMIISTPEEYFCIVFICSDYISTPFDNGPHEKSPKVNCI